MIKSTSSGYINRCVHARSRTPAQLRLVVDSGGFTARRRARPPHPIHREPADQAAGETISAVSAAQPQRQDRCTADRRRRAAALLCPAHSRARRKRRATCLARPRREGAVRLGIPEDFAAYRLPKLLANFARSRPGLRLDVRADQSKYLRRDLRARRHRSRTDQARRRRERRHCGVARARALGHQQSNPIDAKAQSLPLYLSRSGCLYRNARDPRDQKPAGATGTWPIPAPACPAFRPRSPPGSGVSILPQIAIQADHRVLTAKDGFAPIDKTEVALVASPDGQPGYAASCR